jgi:hypothetical protein
MEELKKINELVLEAIKIRKQIADCILNLPDNPNINRIGDGNCFTIKFSELEKNEMIFSAEYYDFKVQYKAIHRALIDVSLEHTIDRLFDIITKGSVTIGKHNIRLNPEVVQNLKSII